MSRGHRRNDNTSMAQLQIGPDTRPGNGLGRAYSQLLAQSVEARRAKARLTATKPEKARLLTDAQVTEMRHLRETAPKTWTLAALAEKFGCSKGYASSICSYRTRVKGPGGGFTLC